MTSISMRAFVGIPALLAAGIAVAPLTPYAQQPNPGDQCQNWHATTQDSNGRTLTCVHTAWGGHLMFWEYGGQSDTGG
jgi:hypothetical protein